MIEWILKTSDLLSFKVILPWKECSKERNVFKCLGILIYFVLYVFIFSVMSHLSHRHLLTPEDVGPELVEECELYREKLIADFEVYFKA